jgi:hypothetical protein
MSDDRLPVIIIGAILVLVAIRIAIGIHHRRQMRLRPPGHESTD